MRINYPKAIGESEEDLMSLEQRLRGQKAADRVRMLRLLKSGTAKSLQDCAPLVGYSAIQVTRWWERYRQAGLSELLKEYKPVGMTRAHDARGVGRFDGRDAQGRHGDHARCTRLPGAGMGNSLQEWQVALVAVQEASSACGRPDAGDTRKPVPSSKLLLKKLQRPD